MLHLTRFDKNWTTVPGDRWTAQALAIRQEGAAAWDAATLAVVAAPLPERPSLIRQALQSGKSVLCLGIAADSLVEALALDALGQQCGRRLICLPASGSNAASILAPFLNNDFGAIRSLRIERYGKSASIWDEVGEGLSILSVLLPAPCLGLTVDATRSADIVGVSLRYSASTAQLLVSAQHPHRRECITVIGDGGRITWDNEVVTIEPPAKKTSTTPIPPQNRYAAALAAFGEDVPGPSGLDIAFMLETIRNATRAHQPVTPGNMQASITGAMVHPTAWIDPGVTIGTGSSIWHFSHILSRVQIGRNVVIGQNVMIGPDVQVGNNCKIQNNVSLYRGVTLEDDVFCGPSCVFTNVNNPRAHIERKSEFRNTLVKRGASIGANATIVCGNTLGAYSFIAAGAVVTSDVPNFAMMAGVPARRIGWMSHAGIKLGPDLTCPAEGRRYRQVSPDRLEEIS